MTPGRLAEIRQTGWLGWCQIVQVLDAAETALAEADRLRAQVAAGSAVLDRYSNDEKPEDLESPEDAWRLFRDMRAALAPGEAPA